MARKEYCNPKTLKTIVHADTRHSPKYGLEFFEQSWWPTQSLCTLWSCGPVDVNAWHDSAEAFMYGDYEDQIKITKQTLKKKQGGKILDNQKLEIDRAEGILEEWEDKYGSFERFSEIGAFFKGNPHGFYRDQSMRIVEIFDRAACEMDALINLQPEGSYAIHPPMVSQRTPSSGSWFGNDDDGSGVGLGGGMAIMLGIGLAGFIGYKAFTE